ncbi:MAG: pilus assembly PilX N-terminal domain-containing protein [Planctomycetota bacterium]|nr:MAG: pilus assembly PilX N-terminal domain-containing protein [Planctomycetota bacterium]
MFYRKLQKGAAFVISLIVLAILSVWAVAIHSMSGANVQIADNQRKGDSARACAESGVDILRFWLSELSMPSTTATSAKFGNLANFMQNDLPANIAATYNGDDLITVSPVTINSTIAQNFAAQISDISGIEPNTIQVNVTGTYEPITRTVRVNYEFGPRVSPIFDYGVATKGPLNLSGNIEMSGANIELDSSVYIETEDPEALSIIGNSSIAGDVYITNPDAIVDLQGGQASIGGETGQAAIDNHVNFGVEPTEFPVPNPAYFLPYVQNTYDPNDVLTEYENLLIPAGSNPVFGALTIRGVVFIEAPNVVTFAGDSDITGIIVGNGDLSDNSGTNQIIFLGTVTSYPVTDLPYEPQFEHPSANRSLHDETGTFLMAPGFAASFGGTFNTFNGAIAANGIEFFGDAGGIIDGSVINYSPNAMVLSGNNDLYFNRSGTTETPAGFEYEIVLYYDSSSYSEVVF